MASSSRLMRRSARLLCVLGLAFVTTTASTVPAAVADDPPAPPVPAWAAGMGMRDLENEILARVDDSVAQHKLSPAKAAEIKTRMASLMSTEQVYRAARHAPPGEWERINKELASIAFSLPDIPPLHPPESPPTNAEWVLPQSPAALDLTGYHATFDDEFDKMDVAADGGRGRWYAPVHRDFGEAHFMPPAPGGPFSIARQGPMGLGGSALAISATKGKGGWRSGLLQTVDSHGSGFAQQYGYFEMRAKFPQGQATWPGFWLLTLNGFTDPSVTRGEIDVVEQYGSSPERIHTSVHLWPAAARNAGGLRDHWYKSEKIVVGDMSSDFHRYGVMLTSEWVITYYDGQELSRFPTPAQYRTPVYMLVDLAMHDKNLKAAKSPSVMLVDYVRAYAKG